VTENGGIGYNPTFNFHDPGRVWLGGAAPVLGTRSASAPKGRRSRTGEVTGTRGIDLDIDVVARCTTSPGGAM
jgi:hypothetical protein